MANRTVLWDEFCPSFLHNLQQLIKEAMTSPNNPIVQFDTTLAQSQTSPQNGQTRGNPSQIGQERIMKGNYLTLFLIERVCYAVLHLVKMSQIMEFSLRCHKNCVSKSFLSK